MFTARSVARALWQHRIAVTFALAFLFVTVLLAATLYTFNLPKFALDHQQTVVLGPTQFAPENPRARRVVIRDNETNQPIANANVTVQMIPKGSDASQTLVDLGIPPGFLHNRRPVQRRMISMIRVPCLRNHQPC